ncbi:MAG: hypothetical protein GXP55_06290 [Deltaproteobacteria bacterium]|nr:hypothetical protein [Deltaproteobacteria bacterium]
MTTVGGSRGVAWLLGLALAACGGGGGGDSDAGDADVADSEIADGDTEDADAGCSLDEDCDDGLYCNGPERCAPDDPTADTRGCAPAPDACLEGQTCDEDTDLCLTECDVSGDADGDGHDSIDCGGDDCDDADASRFPGATEVCDLDDEDCDPTTFGDDADGDGFQSSACCNGPTSCGLDCNDAVNTVNPGAAEQCNGGIDDNCNGLADLADGVCVPCAAGYTGFDGACTDVDECATSGFCGTGATGCTNSDGSFTCTCATGYSTASAMGALCENIDECAAATNPCDTGTCTDNAGSYVCTCAAGYRLATSPTITCVDVDECADGTDLCTDAAPTPTCENTTGSYLCNCPSGYEGSGRVGVGCTDINECAGSTDDCNTNATCANTISSFTCTCVPGYTGAGHGAGGCANVNECADSAAQCGRTLGGGAVNSCLDTSGGYTCSCGAGFTASGSGLSATCVNTNECGAAAQCGRALGGGAVNACADTSGGYACVCGPGFMASGSGLSATCVNVNECGSAAQCGRAVSGGGVNSCTDTSGGYSCSCGPGFRLSGSGLSATCVNIDECATPSRCGRSGGGGGVNSCADSSGGYTCSCGAGFDAAGSGLGATCLNINECTAGTDDCETVVGVCTDTGGGFTCACPTGFSGTAHGVGSCLWNDPSLTSLGVGMGASLSPSFTPTGATYTLTLGPEALTSTLTPSVAWPARTTIEVDGSVVTSGDNVPVSVVGFAPRPVSVVVTTEGGARRTYTITILRSPVFAKASNTGDSDNFGYTVSMSADGTRLAVGTRDEDSNATGIDGNQANNSAGNSGAVYMFAKTGSTWAQEAYIKASNTATDDSFGQTLSLSADGTRLAVGAPGEDSSALGIGGDQNNNVALQSGAVYVFSRTGTTWSQEAYIKASNTQGGDQFGSSVSLSADGARLAVGAPTEDSNAIGVGGNQANNSAGSSGAAYMFSRSGTTWSQEAYIKASNTEAGDAFGVAVSLSGDASRLAVTAPSEDSNATGSDGDQSNNGAANSGAVYVFSRSGSVWSQEAYVKASNTESDDQLGGGASYAPGTTLCFSGDGLRLAVGAPLEDSNASGVGGDQTNNDAADSGAIYVFSRSGSTWSQEAYVKASNTDAGDQFGNTVSLSTNGSVLATGAWREDSIATGIGGNQANGTVQAGAAYVFSRSGVTWTQQAYIKPPNTARYDLFGYSVALSGDGSRLAAGALEEESNARGIGGNQANNSTRDAGAVYIY